MKFDTIIIGGGLSGLVCGIRLSQQGKRCVIISSGQSALHFSSGSFDLLNTLPDGKEVESPLASVADLVRMSPDHPYAKLGADKFPQLVTQAEQFFADIQIPLQGTATKNHYRITPMGTLKPTWLTTTEYAVSDVPDKLPWKKVAIFNIIGFLDFYPKFIADEFAKMGTESDIHLFDLPDFEYLRRNPTEMRSTNIARMLDKEENVAQLIKILKQKSGDSEAVVFPDCMGLDNTKILDELKEGIGKPVILIPTLPPSIIGIHMQQYMHDYFIKLGGVYMLGDSVNKADVVNNRVTKVYSFNHGDIPFTAKDVVLATGSYFSQGLIATNDRVYEPIFDLDVSYLSDRQQWYNSNVFERQGYQQFGVKTDKSFHGLYKGQPIDNLYVSGAVLESFNPIKEGSGAGVSILSALYIADRILDK